MNRSNSESDDGPLLNKSDFYNQDWSQVIDDLHQITQLGCNQMK